LGRKKSLLTAGEERRGEEKNCGPEDLLAGEHNLFVV